MAAIKGLKLTFNDGTVFRCSADVHVTHSGESIYLLDGRENLVALYNAFQDNQGGQEGRSDSNMSTVFAGFGAGVHTIEVSFIQVVGSGDQWGSIGSIDNSNTAVELRDRLARALTTIRMDSEAVGLLEVGEFSSGGIYDEIPVAALSWTLDHRVRDQEASQARGSITFGDSIDLKRAIDAAERVS